MILLGMFLVLTIALLTLATPYAPRAGLAAGWFLITLLPVSNFFFPIGVLIAERTLYMPSLAVCFLAGYAWEAVARTVEKETRRLAVAVAVVIVVVFSGRTIMRNPDWDSLLTVWKSLMRDHPESYRSQWLAAIGAWEAGNMQMAERYFLLAERIWARDSQMLSEFANFYIGQRKYDKAIEYLERARDMTPFVPRTHELLAYSYLHGGRTNDALSTARHAATLESSHPSITHAVIAGALERQREYQKATDAWRVVVGDKSGDIWLNWGFLARAQARAGNKETALRSAEIAASKAKSDRTKKVVTDLKRAINGGCYDLSPTPDCDALQGWQIGVVSPVTPGQ
jgi:tetratricopeptide (TPR) repeat protein